MMADFRDQLKVVKGQLKKPTVRVVFSEAITDTGKTVQFFENDNSMLSCIKAYVPIEKWNFKVFHRAVGKWAWTEVLNHSNEGK